MKSIKNLLLLPILLLVTLPLAAQSEAPTMSKADNPVSFYVRGGYVASHTSLLPSVTSLITNDNAASYPGVSLVAGFRKPFAHGWYGGMEAGLFYSRQKYSYKETDYSTLFDDTVKYIYTDDIFNKFSFQLTPLLVGYRYELLDFLTVDLHAGLNMRFCPMAYRSTTTSYETIDSELHAAGTIGWDDFTHFSYCLQYGFGFTFFDHYTLDVSARGLNGVCLSLGYEFGNGPDPLATLFKNIAWPF